MEDRGQQDTLLSALSLLQGAADRGGQERSKDRPVSRMDSGYYDGPRDSESDDLGSTPFKNIFFLCGSVRYYLYCRCECDACLGLRLPKYSVIWSKVNTDMFICLRKIFDEELLTGI